MKDKDFEKWLIREEGILKVAKEVDDWCDNDVFVDELYKRYRQLEKDNKALDEKHDDCIDSLCDAADEYFKMKEANAELLAALKPFVDAQTKYEKSCEGPDGLGDWRIEDTLLMSNFITAHQVYTKHKGE